MAACKQRCVNIRGGGIGVIRGVCEQRWVIVKRQRLGVIRDGWV